MLQCVDGINRFDRLFGERQAVAGIEPEIRLREGVDIDVRVTWNIPCSASQVQAEGVSTPVGPLFNVVIYHNRRRDDGEKKIL